MPQPHDIKDAANFYDSFIGALKWTVPLLVVIAAVVVVIIS